jgi:hypothetical protein
LDTSLHRTRVEMSKNKFYPTEYPFDLEYWFYYLSSIIQCEFFSTIIKAIVICLQYFFCIQCNPSGKKRRYRKQTVFKFGFLGDENCPRNLETIN